MALFNNTYSGLITKGLGLPACVGLITMGFGLFKATIEVIIPPTPPTGGGSGGGGGSFAVHPGIYVPWPKKVTPKTRMILITVKMGGDKTWRRSYTVDNTRAAIAVKVVNLVNATSQKLAVGVEHLKTALVRVTAFFKDEDK